MEKWFRIIQSKMRLWGIIVATTMLLIIEISLVHLYYTNGNEQDEANKGNNNVIASDNSNSSNNDIETSNSNNNVEINDNANEFSNNETVNNNSSNSNNSETVNNNSSNINNSGTNNNDSSNTNNSGTVSNNSSNSNNNETVSNNSSNSNNNGTSNNNSSNTTNNEITSNDAETPVTYSPSILIYTGNGTTTKYSDYTLEYSVLNVYDNAKIIIKNNNNIISQKTITSSSSGTLRENIVLTEGNNNIEIIATNSVGKTSSENINITYTISSPKVWIDSSSGNTTRYSDYNFSYSFQDIYNLGVNVVIKVNDSIVKELYGITAPPSVTVTLSEGENKIEVIVTNQKGKSGSATKTVTYNK